MHLFYAFPTNVSQEVHNWYINILWWLHSREFAIAPTINWNKWRELGLLYRLSPFLTKTFVGSRITFTCKGWGNLLAIQERVYKDLCVEFFSTLVFQDNMEDPNFPQALVFCLVGEYRECSLSEFAWRMSLYEAHETMTPIFAALLRAVVREYFGGVSRYEFWSNISVRNFNLGVSPESNIRSRSITLSTASSPFLFTTRSTGIKSQNLSCSFVDHLGTWSMLQHTLLFGKVFSRARGQFSGREPDMWWTFCDTFGTFLRSHYSRDHYDSYM